MLTAEALLNAWRSLLPTGGMSWVLYENGTVVVLKDATDDLEHAAAALLAKWGHTPEGLPSNDAKVFQVRETPGWVVTSHFVDGFDMLTYVGRDEFEGGEAAVDVVARLGCERLARDVEDVVVVHVERGTDDAKAREAGKGLQ